VITLKKARARYVKIKKLRAKGFTLEIIGKAFGISRERVRQILEHGNIIGKNYRKLSPTEKYLISIHQDKGRSRARELVRMRDKHTCRDCGLVRKTTSVVRFNKKLPDLKGRRKSLDVHHTKGQCGKNSVGYDSVKDISKMITLCHRCHYNRPEHKCKSKEFAKSLKEIQLKRFST